MRPEFLDRSLATTIALALLAGCGNGAPPPGDAADSAVADDKSPIPTAPEPAGSCDWIPVSEVESAIGKLAAPPKETADGCRYTLAMTDEVRDKRQEHVERMDRLRSQFKDASIGNYRGPMANFHRDPASYALTLAVDVSGSVAGELGASAAANMLRAEIGGADAPPAVAEGWDAQTPVPYGFSGRLGHIRVSVEGHAPDLAPEISQALAARVRDAVPDMPFATSISYQMPTLGAGQDPCSLLTTGEVETVLGTLAVEPYRASSETPALALADGEGCAWFTKGHHVFSLVPVWEGGQQEFKLNKEMGALMSSVIPEDLTVVKGPWDESHVAATGALLFRRGDQLLHVHYKTSSTDMRGAAKLAAQAMQRMTSD